MIPLRSHYENFLRHSQIYQAGDRILCALSGGKDSMTLAHLLHLSGQPIAIAHCNFCLRGQESDEDQNFVMRIAEQYGVPFEHKTFDTKGYAAEHKLSIQVAARNLRYAFLEEARQKHNCTFIATAHHQQDLAETILYNLIKGTGFAGMKGIPLKNGKVIRPLLTASPQQIEHYVHEHQLNYREDSSNASSKYSRNKIRHEVLPVLKQINPKVVETLQNHAQRFQEMEVLYHVGLQQYRKKLLKQDKTAWKISIALIQQMNVKSSLLFEVLRPFDFHADQCQQVLKDLDGQPGKRYLSPSHQIIRDRKFLIITELKEKQVDTYLIEEHSAKIDTANGSFKLSQKKADQYQIKRDPFIAAVDYHQISWPLLLRTWKQGDYFYPLGMKRKKKKVSQVFKDHKVPIHEKDKYWVLQDQSGKILWLAGLRMDERFRIKASTKELLEIKWVTGQ